MAFDIHQLIIDNETGEFLEEKAQQYIDELSRLFYESPEGQAMVGQGGWTPMMLDYAFGYLGVPLPELTASDLEEVLLDIFPTKVSTPPDSAPAIVAELRAFWRFLKREFALENADSNLNLLDQAHIVGDLEEALGDTSLYGPAKSMVMLGMRRGFDMTTPEGVDKWIMTYNAEMKAALDAGVQPLGLGAGDDWDEFGVGSGKSKRSQSAKKAKAKRKAEKASRKRNRRR